VFEKIVVKPWIEKKLDQSLILPGDISPGYSRT
jgi:hypothetical protein